MASREISELLPIVKAKAEAFIEKCKENGIDVLVYCTYRPNEEQAALFAQGRETLDIVNKLRANAGLYLLTEDCNKIVTFARPGQSAHNHRKAFDCAPMVGGKPVWDENDPLWQKLGENAEAVGLKWAGRWKRFREYPHMYDAE